MDLWHTLSFVFIWRICIRFIRLHDDVGVTPLYKEEKKQGQDKMNQFEPIFRIST